MSSQFCGLANCAECLFKTRPYPKDNPTKERRGQICLPCNKKFLYRDVKHDLIIKLEVKPSRDAITEATEDDLDNEELLYNRKINELRNLRETKITQLDTMREMQNSQTEHSEELNSLQRVINNLIQDKDRLNDILRANKQGLEEKIASLEQFQIDLVKIERAIGRREERIAEYDLEIESSRQTLESVEKQRQEELK